MSARILIVDDMQTSVKVLAAKLTGEYYDVITAYDGPTALEQIRSETPDLVLLDVMMPGMDGFEVCREIKQTSETAHIPVVMVTALNDVRDRVEGLKAGADDFLTKPVVDTTLFARVRSLVRTKRTLDQWRQHEETSRRLGFDALATPLLDDGRDADIAIVDPSAIQAQNLREVMANDHHSVRVIADYVSAREAFETGPPDVAVISMAYENDGALRLASQLRSTEATRYIPILLIGDEDEQEALIKGLEIGVNDYVIRPVDEREIVARVRTQVRRKRYQDRLQDNFVDHLSLALTDSLTGLHNRRYMETHVAGMLKTAYETGKSTSVLVIDVDTFKEINDHHGHDVGDQVLKEVAKRILKNVRGFDLTARLGGDEFFVAMPDTPQEVAAAVAERIRLKVEEEPVAKTPEGDVLVTLSIGLAEGAPAADGYKVLVGRADEALFEAKRAGRNRVNPPPSGHRLPTEAVVD